MKIQDWRAALTRCLLLAVAAIALDAAHAAPAAPLSVLQPSARVIVKLKPWSALLAHPADAAASQAHPMAALGGRMGLALGEGRHLGERTQVVTARGLSSAALARRLARQSDVEYAVVDHVRRASSASPDDPEFVNSTQWYLQAPGGALYSPVNAPAAWAITHGASDQVVAVLDTGIRPDLPDLVGKIAVGYDMISDQTEANDGSGRDNDPSDPGDWSSNCSDPSLDSPTSSWHGTQVAGIIGAATDNALGIAGLGWNVKIIPVRVLGRCGGYDSDIIAGMRWAAGLSVPGLPLNPYPAKIINLSLGAQGTCSSAYVDVIQSLFQSDPNIVIVAAAGNSDGGGVDTPANCPGVIAVGGLNENGLKASVSAQGAGVAISAPAGDCGDSTTSPPPPCNYPIVSISDTGTTTPQGTEYTAAGVGTSYSAAMVSATVALMRSVNPDMSAADVLSTLKSSARPFPTPTDSTIICPSSNAYHECFCTDPSSGTSTCGAGMLDAGNAVQAAQAAYWSTHNTAQAGIGVTPLTPYAGQQVTLDVTPSLLPSGTHVVSCLWTITDGGGIVTDFEGGGTPMPTSTVCPDPASSASTDAKPQLKPTGPGDIQVTLTLTVNDGTQDITLPAVTRVIHVISPLSNPVSSTSSGGGGGGALDAWPLTGLALAIGLLAASGRQRQGVQR